MVCSLVTQTLKCGGWERDYYCKVGKSTDQSNNAIYEVLVNFVTTPTERKQERNKKKLLAFARLVSVPWVLLTYPISIVLN